jgi:hypothetical protein
MLNMLKVNVELLKKIVVTTLVSVLLISCDTTLDPNDWDSRGVGTLELDTKLYKDVNGYYHLTLNRDKWQTLHKITGSITENEVGVENFRVEWESNLYWYIGDTLGYVVNRYINQQGQYVSVDTSYMIGFNGQEVPTTNKVSLSNSKGELNNMIAPVNSMIGDTMKLTADWDYENFSFYIVLD